MKRTVFAVVSVLLLAAGQAAAVSFETVARYTHYQDTFPGPVQTAVVTEDARGPADAGSLLSAVAPDYGISARAYADEASNAAVAAEGLFAYPETSSFDYGDVLFASSELSEEVAVSADETYTYSFTIDGAGLRIDDYAGADATMTGAPFASYLAEIYLDSTRIWFSSASLTGGQYGYALMQSGEELPIAGHSGAPGYHTIAYSFGSFSDSLDLGDYTAGDTFTVRTVLSVQVSAFPAELGGAAHIADPPFVSGTGGLPTSGFSGSLSSSPTGGGGTPPAPVPEPGTLLLLGTGLAAVAGTRRRKGDA